MAKKEIELMSKNAYALYLGVSEKAIRNAIVDGKINKGFDKVKKKIIKHIADREYGQLHSVVKPRPGISSDTMAVRISNANSDLNSTKNSDVNSEVKKNTASPKKPSKKAPVTDEDSDDIEAEDLEDFTYEQLMEKIKITPSLSYSEAYRRTSILNLAAEKMKAEIQQKAYVKRADVETAQYEFASHLKKALMSIPSRIADEILNSKDTIEIINVITKELNNVLTDYSLEAVSLEKNDN